MGLTWRGWHRLIVVPALLWAGAASAASTGGAWTLGLGLDVAGGSYGNATSTRYVAIPLLLRYTPSARLSLALDLPWLYQSNSVTTYGSTGPMAGSRTGSHGGFSAAAGVSAAAGGPHGGGPGGSGMLNLAPDQSQSGLGDATLGAAYALVEEGVQQPRLSTLVYLKIPLADKDKGLGTGKFDGGAGLALAKSFGFTRYFARGSYIVRGHSTAYGTQNYLSYGVGASYLYTFDLQAGLSLTGATAPIEAAPAPLEARIQLNYRLSERLRLEGSVGHGLSDGSPDLAGGIAVLRRLD